MFFVYGIMADSKINENDIYKAAVKRSTAELIVELAVAFPHDTSLKLIHNLTRDELLDVVIHTRSRLNSLSAVKQIINGDEKPPELFSLVGRKPVGGATISELGRAITVTSATPVTVAVITTAAGRTTDTVTSPQVNQSVTSGGQMARPSVSGVITTAAITQPTGSVQPTGGGMDASGLGGIAQILAVMQASQQQMAAQTAEREARLAAQTAEREVSLKLEFARLAA